MRYIEPQRPHGQPHDGRLRTHGARRLRGRLRTGVLGGLRPQFAPRIFRLFFQLTEHEPKRAAKFGLKHFCWLCINSKEAEDVKLAEEVIALIPKFLNRPNVLGIGEIGLNKNSRNELRVLEMLVELAAK